MAATTTCPICKLAVSPPCETYKGKKYHSACFETLKAAARAKDAQKSARNSDPDRKLVEDLLLEVFQLSALSPQLIRQIDQYSQQYSFADMFYALRWYFILEDNEPSEDSSPTIGILPYIFAEAMEYRQSLDDAAEANATFQPQTADTTVQIHRPANKYRQLGYDMGDL